MCQTNKSILERLVEKNEQRNNFRSNSDCKMLRQNVFCTKWLWRLRNLENFQFCWFRVLAQPFSFSGGFEVILLSTIDFPRVAEKYLQRSTFSNTNNSWILKWKILNFPWIWKNQQDFISSWNFYRHFGRGKLVKNEDKESKCLAHCTTTLKTRF